MDEQPQEPEKTYVFDRGRPFIDLITEEHARQIYERARARPAAELTGTLEAGFEYTVAKSSSISFLRVKVYPLEQRKPDGESGQGGEDDA